MIFAAALAVRLCPIAQTSAVHCYADFPDRNLDLGGGDLKERFGPSGALARSLFDPTVGILWLLVAS